MPLRVSIVTPSYNQGRFLSQTLNSIFDQNHQPLEVMVIDGGSTDNSVEVIKAFDSRLAYWVSEKDKGQADAINKGFRRVTGDIVAFLNSDDYYLPGAIAAALEVFEREPDVGVVYGQARWVTVTGEAVSQTRVNVDGQAMLEQFEGLPQPATFWRRAVLEKVGVLDPTFHFALDGEFFVRALGNFRAVSLDAVLACMRLHPAAKSVSASTGFAPEVLRIAEKVIENPAAYPRYRVEPAHVRAGARVVAARFLFMGGEFRQSAGYLLEAARMGPRYLKEIVLHELPRFAMRAALGRPRYEKASAALNRVRR